MKKNLIFGAILIMAMSCSKNLNNNVTFEDPSTSASLAIDNSNLHSLDTVMLSKYLIYKPLTVHEKDSIDKVDSQKANIANIAGTANILGEYPEYSDGSNQIHLKIFYNTSSNTANLQELSVSVTDSYAMVGGGALAYGYTGNGAFLTKSYPLNYNTWIARSKAHIILDPHYLTVYAIGMRIDNVDPAYLRSKIHITSNTSTLDNDFPSTSVSVPDNCLLIGGGAYDRYFGYGNLLTASGPNGNEWFVEGKAYRRSDPSRITAYAIGIENISYPTVGYLQISVRQTQTGSLIGEGFCYADVWEGFALSCPGGYTIYHTYGRMLVGVYPLPDTQVISKDTPGYGDFGATGAYAVGIQKRPY